MIQGYRYEDELAERIAPYTYRRELRDCRDAPPGVYQFLDVEFTPEQKRIYTDLRESATSELAGGETVTALMAMTRLMRMHQVCLGFVPGDDTRKLQDIPERRTAALVGLLRDYGGKAVIWCAYDPAVRRVIAALKREFGPESVAAFWGGNSGTRYEEERRFKGSGECRWMVATAAAGGRGREWSVADLVVYHSNTENLEHRDQSEDRVESYSKVDPITRVDIRVPGTVEDKIIKNLRAKITMASALMGDSYRSWLV
jgi:SNF2 family DNA or RNA helicase